MPATAQTVVFENDFDAEGPPALNYTAFANFTVVEGFIDLLGDGVFSNLCIAAGAANASDYCVDLDGSGGNGGTLVSDPIALTGGRTYRLDFLLAGNQRGDIPEPVRVTFGGAPVESYALPSAQDFTAFSIEYTPAVDENATVTFVDSGNDNVGHLLDAVSVTELAVDDTEAPVCGALTFVPVDGTYEIVSSATDNIGIERLTFTTLTPNLEGIVEGFGGFSQGDFVNFIPPDPDVSFGARFLTLSAASFFVTVEDAAGNTAVCDPVLTDLAGALPEATALLPSYPNPARVGSSTAVTVPFRLAEAADVRVVVYDVLGREVAVLADEVMEPGRYEVSWPEARSLPSGSYVVQMTAGAHVQTQRLTLVR